MNSHSKKEMTSSESQNKQDDAPAITFVGLDISKARLDIHHSGKHREERNNPEGHHTFIKHLRSLPHPRVICEATGGYETAIVAALLEARIEVCLVMPARVRRFADANGWMAKTDRIDARVLAAFGESIKPRLELPADPNCLRLREMLDYRRFTSEQLIDTGNRLELSTGYLREGIEIRIAALKADLKRVDKEIAAHIAAHPTLAAKSKRMTQMKGVGPVLAATILAYLPELGELEDKQIASLAGVAPHPKDSGNSRFRRPVAGGRLQVRNVLYMAATSATRSNPILREFYQRLKTEKGKPHKVAMVAVMRKMLTVLNKMMANPEFSLA
jgi:transposase